MSLLEISFVPHVLICAAKSGSEEEEEEADQKSAPVEAFQMQALAPNVMAKRVMAIIPDCGGLSNAGFGTECHGQKGHGK